MVNAQSAIRYDLDRDVKTAGEMAARLKPYIYEEELYGQMPGDLPKLTVGGLLMRLHRLSAILGELASKQREVVQEAQKKLDEIRRDWAVALEGKVQREFQARLTSVDQFVNECSENPRNCLDNYPNAAEKRVILQSLADEAEGHGYLTDQMKGALSVMDNKLHRYLSKGDFIWDKRLEKAYLPDKYWFLYVK